MSILKASITTKYTFYSASPRRGDQNNGAYNIIRPTNDRSAIIDVSEMIFNIHTTMIHLSQKSNNYRENNLNIFTGIIFNTCTT